MSEVKQETKRVQVYIPPEDVKQLKLKMIERYGRSNISELSRKLYKKFLNGDVEVDLDI